MLFGFEQVINTHTGLKNMLRLKQLRRSHRTDSEAVGEAGQQRVVVVVERGLVRSPAGIGVADIEREPVERAPADSGIQFVQQIASLRHPRAGQVLETLPDEPVGEAGPDRRGNLECQPQAERFIDAVDPVAESLLEDLPLAIQR